ncbi:hypothetical protein CRC_02810 [Cylindrospermopsis raciborskii CS-505]|nr:hypothetical protein CRC_02810 [Cylindrospermopsis raciborskii CS-505]KRH98134.1 hypothetical protein ASL19_13470 [Cylindrospermopsis sp. CR12]
MLILELVRVQRCGKSAPAVSRGTGSVNPGWEQGQRNYGWSFTSFGKLEPLEVVGNNYPRQITTLAREQNPAYVLLSLF